MLLGSLCVKAVHKHVGEIDPRSKSNRNEVRFRNKYKEGWSAWVSIRRVELGIEATGQLLLQVEETQIGVMLRE